MFLSGTDIRISNNLPEPSAAVDAAALIGLTESALTGRDRWLKRIVDLLLSTLLLLIFWPGMLLIALLIKLDSAGPVLFRQQRLGEGGHLFWMYKFRSMVNGAEMEEARLLQMTAVGRPLFAKSPEDERVTRIGRLLRRISLEPSIINTTRP